MLHPEIRERRPEHPSSERWAQYYLEAKARRRARGHRARVSWQRQRWRAQQRARAVGALLALGMLFALFGAILEH